VDGRSAWVRRRVVGIRACQADCPRLGRDRSAGRRGAAVLAGPLFRLPSRRRNPAVLPMNLKMPSLISNNLRILRFMGATRVKSSGWSHFGRGARQEPAKAGTPNGLGQRLAGFGVPPSGGRGQNEKCWQNSLDRPIGRGYLPRVPKLPPALNPHVIGRKVRWNT
jgi:hypothetical protein